MWWRFRFCCRWRFSLRHRVRTFPRHCERSEAISFFILGTPRLLHCAGNFETALGLQQRFCLSLNLVRECAVKTYGPSNPLAKMACRVLTSVWLWLLSTPSSIVPSPGKNTSARLLMVAGAGVATVALSV